MLLQRDIVLPSQFDVFIDDFHTLLPDICHKFRPGCGVHKGITALFQLAGSLFQSMAVIGMVAQMDRNGIIFDLIQGGDHSLGHIQRQFIVQHIGQFQRSHTGAANEFRNLYGTKVALSAVDTKSMAQRPRRASGIFAQIPQNLPVIDHQLEDGEIFTFGGKEIRCVLTPGHTLGTMSFFFDVTDNGTTYLAGQYGGAGVNALKLPYALHHQLPLDMAQRMVESLDRVKDEPVAVHLGNHPYNNHTLEKRERQLKEGGNPFVDTSTWPEFVADIRQKSLKIMEENAQLARQHQIDL